jgi:hypothetical protein
MNTPRIRSGAGPTDWNFTPRRFFVHDSRSARERKNTLFLISKCRTLRKLSSLGATQAVNMRRRVVRGWSFEAMERAGWAPISPARPRCNKMRCLHQNWRNEATARMAGHALNGPKYGKMNSVVPEYASQKMQNEPIAALRAFSRRMAHVEASWATDDAQCETEFLRNEPNSGRWTSSTGEIASAGRFSIIETII